jgi:hypothetical protein
MVEKKDAYSRLQSLLLQKGGGVDVDEDVDG